MNPLVNFRQAAFVLLLVSSSLMAAEPSEEVVVIGVTPNQGVGLEKDKIPYNVQSASSEDLENAQSLDVSDYLNRNIGSININDAASNPLQPDVQFRGYSASPLLGLAQGIAVYQNGVRINEPLGDSVNWDLLPESAIANIDLIGGANPLFGLNTLGGALSITMKNGFNSEGHHLKIHGGSFDRLVMSAESSGNNGEFAYYGNIHYFEEDGWREQSPSDAINFYGSFGWRNELSDLNLNFQHGNSDLIGNGSLPVELLEIDRNAIFTAPDITENNMYMFSLDGSHSFNDKLQINANSFYRRNKTKSFNGDGSEFSVCDLGGTDTLVEGLEEDDLDDLGLDDDDVCDNQFADSDALEVFLNTTALALGEDDEFNIEDLSADLSGSGILSDQAINNISDRNQKSYGADLQLTFSEQMFGHDNLLITGFAYIRGDSEFNSVLELADLDPITRSTQDLGTATFVDEAATNIDTKTETLSFYFSNTLDINQQLSLTFSGRINNTQIRLSDQSGERPELNGEHDFFRFNPAVGLTYRHDEKINFYAGYNESSRTPTPIELACNDSVFNLAVAAAIADGDDPEDVEFECRLPNAFLADPPLEQVVTKSFEVGSRGELGFAEYHLGFFHSTNKDDIIFQTTGRATGLFANVDETQRWGIETTLRGHIDKIDWFTAYSYLEASFEDNFNVLSPNHPFADDNGEIFVRAGDRIPGLPKHNFKIGADYYFNEKVSLGVDLSYNSNQVIRGDESNQIDKLNGYSITNLRGRYRFNEHLEFFARINNVFDKDYESFGLLGEEPSEVDVPLFANFSNPRFLGPGSPRAGFVGVKLSL
ncbi:MAG: TonB-dependent receptor [Gammaproteobacteria bacterium]|jgi:iron complex outermembrane recepter protein|nr:TonB-dependent receptor [Gammaproteobacteria bacterium]